MLHGDVPKHALLELGANAAETTLGDARQRAAHLLANDGKLLVFFRRE